MELPLPRASGSTGNEPLNVLVIGGGGREHALAWKLAQSPRVSQGLRRAGQRGHGAESELTNVALTAIPDLVAVRARRTRHAHGGRPRSAAGGGNRRRLSRRGSEHLRPHAGGRAARELEGLRQGASWRATAFRPRAYETFTDAAAAHAYVDAQRRADRRQGRRARRRARAWSSPTTRGEAHAAIDTMLVGNRLGDAGARVVIEEFLVGRGGELHRHGRRPQRAAAGLVARTTSACCDGDRGPNTGGMGAYSPAPVVTPAVHARVMREIIVPAVKGMAADGVPVHAASSTRA